MKIGLKARFSDLDKIIELQPDFIELHFSDKDPDYDFKPKRKYQIPCFIHLPEIWKGFLIDLCQIKSENQVLPLKESINIVQTIVYKSEKFFKHFNNQKNILVLHPGGMTFERNPLYYNKQRIEILIESMSKIKTENSEILLENLPPYPWYLGGQWNTNVFMDAGEISKFCQITKRKICYDVSHSKLYCNFSGKDFIEQLKLFKPHIGHLHIADAVGTDGEGIQIDEGEINFNDFFLNLKGYNETIVNEIWLGYANNFAGFKTANKRIKNYLAKYF